MRKFLYDYIPLMDLFRFPSLFRLFVIITAIIFSSFSLHNFLYHKEDKYKKNIIIIASIMMGFLAAIFIFSVFKNTIDFNNFSLRDLFNIPSNTSIWNCILVQSFFHIIILFALIYFIKSDSSQKFPWILLILVIGDMSISS